MSLGVSTQPTDGLWASVYAGFGIRGGDVPASGTHGSSPVRDDLAFPGDSDLELTWEIVSAPPTGTLSTAEDLSYTYDPPGGTVNLWTSFAYRIRGDGAVLYTDVEAIVIGSASAPAYTLTLPAASSGSSGAALDLTYAAPGSTTYTLTLPAATSGSSGPALALMYSAPLDPGEVRKTAPPIGRRMSTATRPRAISKGTR